MKKKLFIGLFILTAIVIAGCSNQTSTPAQTTPTPQSSGSGNLGIKQDISISGFAFNPASITIPKGATVIWTNQDATAHNIVSDTGNELNSDTFSKGETFAHTFNTPGTYTYHCGVHPSMKGEIIVQ